LYQKVLALRARGLSYNKIIRVIERTEGVRLNKSHIHDWVNGLHQPFGSVRAFDPEPSPELAYLVGVSRGDADLGIDKWNYRIRLRATDKDFVQAFNYSASVVLHSRPHSLMRIPSRHQWSVEICSMLLYRFLKQSIAKLRITIEHCDACIEGFLRGFFDSEGSMSERNLTVSNTRLGTLRLAKILLGRLGLSVTGPRLVTKGGRNVLIKGRLYRANRNQYVLGVRARSLELFRDLVGFSIARKNDALAKGLSSRPP
jgi:DNA endonuclease